MHITFKFILFGVDIEDARLISEEHDSALSGHLPLLDNATMLQNILSIM